MTPSAASAPLFGRARETGRLRRRIRELPSRGGAVVLRGEPGIGKTALLADAARHAADNGMRVLSTAGVRSEESLPFAGLHGLVYPVRSLIGRLPGGRYDALEGALGARDSAAPPAPLPVALATFELLSLAAARSPVVLLVDDVQRLDRASSEVFALLARRLQRHRGQGYEAVPPVLLLSALRDGCPSPLAAAGLPGLAVGPLSADASAALLDVRAPDLSPEARAVLLEKAAGHPLALTELAADATGRAATDPAGIPWPAMSRRLVEAFTARPDALPPSTRRLLLVAACDEGSSLPEILRAASLRGPDRVEASDLAPAVSARLLEVRGDTFRFRHPLTPAAIRQDASPDLRRAVHAALAGVSRRAPTGGPGTRQPRRPGPAASRPQVPTGPSHRPGRVATPREGSSGCSAPRAGPSTPGSTTSSPGCWRPPSLGPRRPGSVPDSSGSRGAWRTGCATPPKAPPP